MESSATYQPSILHWLPCCSLGSGSFSHVSLALNLSDGLFFAVKSSPCLSPASLDALDNELRLLQSFSSPFILRCFGSDYTTVNGSPVSRNLFLEYMEGGSLADFVKKSGGRLQEKRVRSYTHAVVEGLCYLHQEGIVHCDIKGKNILMGSSCVKIADFGAAKRLCADTEIKELNGTPLWMAPEVIQGKEQGFPSDIWSLGCTVVEMIQGRPPWGHITDAAAALYKIGCSEDCPPMPDAISEEAKDFLLHCLQRDPKARWTAAQLLQHPFMCGIEAENEAKCAQISPRSILDFLRSESDSEDESESETAPLLSYQPSTTTRQASPDSSKLTEAIIIANHCDWIIVKRAANWRHTDKPMPFMKATEVYVTRGCDVCFDSAAFLRNRRPHVG